MKNLTISKKLIVGFSIVLVLMLAAIVAAVISISNLGGALSDFQANMLPESSNTWNNRRDLVSLQRYLLEGILARTPEEAQTALDGADKESAAIQDLVTAFAQYEDADKESAKLASYQQQLTDAGEVRRQIVDLIKEGTTESKAQAYDLFITQYSPAFDKAAATIVDINTDIESYIKADGEAAKATQTMAWVLMLSVAAIAIIVTIAVILIIRKSILNPVKEIEGVYAEMAKGNMQVEVKYESKDELGSMARSIKHTNALLSSYIHDISEKLGQMSHGDMRVDMELDYIGDFSAIKQAILSTASALNHTLSTINTAAEQVSTGASQVSSGAQALAAGSSEQASSVEELSVSITKIAEQAADNSSSVKLATQYVEQANAEVKDGDDHMKHLTEAMANISASSNQITNITETIEDIAFQTNILALNAAIEAARAGNAGRGFAVVADEVRNLAAKSAEAAKQTAELIQRSAVTVNEGSQITAQTALILQNVEKKTNQVNEIINKINLASSEQAIAIDQIKQGLSQVSSVVQTNAATAEENSATSEEMSAQAATLREEVSKFKLDHGYELDGGASVPVLKGFPRQKKIALSASSGLGKY